MMNEPSNVQPAKQTADTGATSLGNWDPDRDPLEELAAEFAERLRLNERPSIEDYVQRYPELADDIRDLFPTIAEMERLNRQRQVDAHRLPNGKPLPFEQLGDFRVIGEIGRGGMGIVYEAEQVTLGRRVAVKVLPSHALRSERDIQRFQREARTAAQLHHSNIVPVFGVGEQDGVHYIVMQFIEGVGLDEILDELKRIFRATPPPSSDSPSDDSNRSKYIKRNAAALLTEELRKDSKSSGPIRLEGSLSRTPSSQGHSPEYQKSTSSISDILPTEKGVSHGEVAPEVEPDFASRMGSEYWRNVARIGAQAAAALHYAHSHGTLHRDIKPGNLLLDSEGVVWIADFGLAKAAEQDNVTWTGDVVGTLCYLAPERFDAEADARGDIYSLGLTLYEMLTLNRAYAGRDRAALIHQISQDGITPPRKSNPEIPRDLETIVLKAIARNPIDRYKTAGLLAADLQNYLDDRPIIARRMSPVERLTRWCGRNRAVAGLTAAVAMLLVAVTVVALIGYARESFERRRAMTQQQRAEVTSALALAALDNIYGQFAPSPMLLNTEAVIDEADESELIGTQTRLPISNEFAGLLENLLEFYDRLSQHAANNSEVLTKSIMANHRVADIHYRLGDYAKASDAYRRAINRFQEIAADGTSRPEMRMEIARIYNGLGTVLREQDSRSQANLRDARAAHMQALELLGSPGRSLEIEYELARTHYLLHRATDRGGRYGRNPERSDHLQLAIDNLHDLVERSPSVPDYRFLLAQCYLEVNRGPGRRNRNRLAHCDRTAAEILEALIEEHPDVPDYRYVLGDALVGQARHYSFQARERGNPPAALLEIEARLLEALSWTENLDVEHPNIPQYLMLNSTLHFELSKVYENLHRPEEWIQQLQLAIRSQEQLIRSSAEPYLHRIWLVGVLQVDRAKYWRQEGRLDDASEHLARQIRRLVELENEPGIDEETARSARWRVSWMLQRASGIQFHWLTWGRLAAIDSN